MKPSGQRWHLHNTHQLTAFTQWLESQWEDGKKPTVQLLKEDRSTNQNALQHHLYRQIADQLEDKSVIDVKSECKLIYGVVIKKSADPEWAKFYDERIKPMSYEAKIELMKHGLPVTSDFTKEQATEYINSIIQDYIRKGFTLAP